MSSFIRPQGSVKSPIWLVCDEPLPKDGEKGYLYSSSLGRVMCTMLADAGIRDVFYLSKKPEKGVAIDYKYALNLNKPPLIIAVDEIARELLPVLEGNRKVRNQDENTQLNKYLGSLLVSKELNFPHYIMPVRTPSYYTQHWDERNITTFFDFQKLREELKYYQKNGFIQKLPERTLIYEDLSLDSILSYFNDLNKYRILSLDIETIYPRDKSEWKNIHPGYPITMGIAPSNNWGMSFSMFRESTLETVILWKAFNELIKDKLILGQNFFEFDWYFLTMLGFTIKLENIIDTRHRHQILWPDLKHKLQFQTRQYTREPYYKDEGQGWSLKNMAKLRRYNCLDVCVTYEVYEQQEEEFGERKQLA